MDEAVNGDTVIADVAAQSTLLPNGLRQVVESGTITGGTGRFEGANLSNRSYDALLAAATDAYRKLTPEVIRSVCRCDYLERRAE